MEKWMTVSRAIGKVSVGHFVNPQTGEVLIESGEIVPELRVKDLLDVYLSVWGSHRYNLILVFD